MKYRINILISFFLVMGMFTASSQVVQWMKPGTRMINCPGFVYFYDMQLDTSSAGGSICGTPSTKSYLDPNNVTETFYTNNGSCIRDSFIAPPLNFLICSADTLYAYDGPNTSSPLIRKMSAGANTTNFTTSGPSITFHFKTDGIVNSIAKGWQMLLKCVPCAAAAPNDDCSTATNLIPGSSCAYAPGFINVPTNATPTAPACAGIPNINDDVWYRFVAINSLDTIKVQSTGTMDAVVQLLSGSCGSLSSLSCANNTGAGGLETLVATSLTVGQTYYIRVFDYNGSGGNGTFNFNICIVSKANTDCAGATQFCSSVPFNGTFTPNSYGVQEYSPGTFGCITFGESTSTWLYWQCQTPGTLGFNIASSNGTAQDVDFALWGPLNSMSCPMTAPPVRCSYAQWYASNSYGLPAYSTGLQAAETDVSEPAGSFGNAFIDTINMKAGKYYVLMMNLWGGNVNYQLNFNLTNGASFNNCLLPVELTSFSGENLGMVNRIYWITESELNSDYFILERSADGITFSYLAIIQAIGNSSTEFSYEYYDQQPLNGLNYYRLKQVDTDGSYSYSAIVSLERPAGNYAGLSLFPNPTRGLFYLTLSSEENCTVMIEVYNQIGQVIHTLQKEANTGDNTFPVDLTGLRGGIYTLKVTKYGMGSVLTGKIVKI